MGKEIKAIECPKCGSTQKSGIRKDYFKCQNCGTEYILDNDDITITHNVNYNHGHAAPPVIRPQKLPAVIVVVIVAFILTAFFVISNLTTPDEGNNLAGEVSYRWWDHDFIGYEAPNGKPIVAIMGQRDAVGGFDTDKAPRIITFYDLLSGKELKSQQITNIPKAKNEDIKFRQFRNGEVYIIVNKMYLFRINKNNMSIQDVTGKTLMRQPKLAAGIANLEFIHSDYGDGFNLLTNDGKNLYFYPGVDKVYTKDEYYKAQEDLQIREPDAKVETYYDFSTRSTTYAEEPIRLMKFTQKDNAGGPNERPYFEVNDYYDDNHQKQLTMFRWGQDLVLSYKDLTPGRLYFSPEVLYGDEQYVLIKFNNTAAEEANTSLQCLDGKTGKIIFTLPFSEPKYLEKDAVRFKNGFIIKNNVSVLAVDMKGKLLNEFKTM